MMRDFEYKITIKDTEVEDVYNALTNPFAIELWSGYSAQMKMEKGAEFSMWDGDICGKIVDFIPNQKIIQEWFFGEQEEASLVEIKLFQQKIDTYVHLRHTNIPDEDFEDIQEGWVDFYWGCIKRFFEEA